MLGFGGPRTPGAAARASLPARRTQYGDELEVVEHDAAHEKEQLDEWGLARHALQNPSGQVDVALRARREPLDLHRAEREQSDPLPLPPGKAGWLVPLH